MNIIPLFCEIDDFFLHYEKWIAPQCLTEGSTIETRGRPRQLHPSEVMTLLIAFHQSGYRTFKHFYLQHVCVYWCAKFPNLVSYSRFVQLKKEVLAPFNVYLSANLGTCSGISFVDSTRLRVCDNRRISSQKVFAGHAGCSKTSMGWFYGFKLHLIINDTGGLLDVALTPGNTDDRTRFGVFLRETFMETSTQIGGISQKTFGRNSTSKVSTWFTKSERTWTRWRYRCAMKCC